VAEKTRTSPGARLLLLCAAITQAAPHVDVTAAVDRAAITVGDPVRYEITVAHPPGARVELPAVRGNTGALEVTGYTVRAGTAPDGRALVTHTLTLAAYAVGADTLPPQRVEIRAPGDTATAVLYTQPTYLVVKPTVSGPGGDIADIHDRERLPGAVPWALPLLAAAALGLWAWLRRRARRPRKAAPPAATRALTADEIALARLRELQASGWSEAGRAREFAFTLSEILREYLANRFGIDALEATTGELLQRVAPLPLAVAQQEWLWHFCGELDAVKFATGALPAADADRLLRETAGFVGAFPATAATAAGNATEAPGGSGTGAAP
jgi:hypothetical protein